MEYQEILTYEGDFKMNSTIRAIQMQIELLEAALHSLEVRASEEISNTETKAEEYFHSSLSVGFRQGRQMLDNLSNHLHGIKQRIVDGPDNLPASEVLNPAPRVEVDITIPDSDKTSGKNTA